MTSDFQAEKRKAQSDTHCRSKTVCDHRIVYSLAHCTRRTIRESIFSQQPSESVSVAAGAYFQLCTAEIRISTFRVRFMRFTFVTHAPAAYMTRLSQAY